MTDRAALFNLKLQLQAAKEAGNKLVLLEVAEVEKVVNPELCHFTVDHTPDGTGQIVTIGAGDTQKHPVYIARAETFVRSVDGDANTEIEITPIYDNLDVGD